MRETTAGVPAAAGARPAPTTTVTAAVLFATAPAEGHGPAAALDLGGVTLVERLVDQVQAVGVPDVRVVARAGRDPERLRALLDGRPGVQVLVSEDPAADLRLVAAVARSGEGGMLVAHADILTQGSVLDGLLADPRVPTGVVTTVRPIGRPFTFRVRHRRGRVVGAASPYHIIHGGDATFMGLLKVDPRDRGRAAAVADRLADLLADPPEAWRRQLEVIRPGSWTLALDSRERRRATHGHEEDAPADEERLEAEALEAEATAELEPGAAGADDDAPAGRNPADVVLAPEVARELELALAAAAEDVVSVLLVGLVRDGVEIGTSRLRYFFWSRPRSEAAVERALERLARRDEDRILLAAAVKVGDGFFTTHFVSPYSRYIARWCAERGFTPNQLTTFSMALGALAAAGFATGERWGLVTGAIVLQAAFTFDCVDGQLARYTRTFSKLGAWLDSIFDRGKEYVVFAGLAIGAARTGDDVWLLACAALGLQVTRHALDFAWPVAQQQVLRATLEHPPLEQPSDGLGPDLPAWLRPKAPKRPKRPRPRRPLPVRILLRWRRFGRRPGIRWAKKVMMFPIGERFATISLTAAFFDARVTFIVLLVVGGLATSYVLAGRLLRAARSRRRQALDPSETAAILRLERFRGDGPLARALGRVLGPRVHAAASTLSASALALLVAAVAATGDHPSAGLAAAAVGVPVVLAGAGRGRPLVEPLRWTVPPALRALEYVGVTWLAARAGGPAVPAGFALLAVAAFRHYDLVYRSRQQGEDAADRLRLLALGWDGRLVAAGVLLATGTGATGLYVLAGALGLLLAGEAAHDWLTFNRTGAMPVVDAEEEDAG